MKRRHFLVSASKDIAIRGGGGGGGRATPLYDLYRYVWPQGVMFLFSRFGHKMTILVVTRIWFLHSCLELGIFFEKKLSFHHYR